MAAYDFDIIIPAYNRADLIGNCLSTFTSPAHEGLQVIVVDDGSTDDTAALVGRIADASRGARIRLIRQKNAGASVARNTGIREASAPFVALLDSDDCWFPWTAEVLQATLSANPQAALLLFQAFRFEDEAQLQEVRQEPVALTSHPSFFDFYMQPSVPLYGSCNVCVRREAFLAKNGFDPDIRSAEDLDLFFRLSGAGPTLALTAPALMGHRSNTPGSLSKNSRNVFDGLQRIHAKHRAGAFQGDPGLIDQALARCAAVGFWILMERGEVELAASLLSETGATIRKAQGTTLYARMLFRLWRNRLAG